MDSLIESDDLCKKSLLFLASRGNSIIAELMRLSDYVPTVFKLDSKLEQQKYGDVILDFTYFKSSEIYDKKIQSSSSLQELINYIRTTYNNIINRIYSAFESIHRFVSDLNTFISELEEGYYVQKTLENVFEDVDCKQLMCEALYLYGVMLLVVDVLFLGLIRERIIVFYHCHVVRKTTRDTSIDNVCKLLRSTGFISHSMTKRPTNYPENYFRRVEISARYINYVNGYLRSDDVFNQVVAYPSPDHRSSALAQQASMLFVCLYFMPSVLNSQSSKMREIVDKFFPENWILNYYMGLTVNLTEAWEPYKAAGLALNNTLEASNIKEKSTRVRNKISQLIEQTDLLFSGSTLNEAQVLEHSIQILDLLRECNVALRWAILHCASLFYSGCEGNKKCRAMRDQVLTDIQYSPLMLLQLMVNVSILELNFNLIYKNLIEAKETKWKNFQTDANNQALELSEVFCGNRLLARVAKNEKLQKWFKEISQQIMGLSLDKPTLSEQKISLLIKALRDVKGFHELDASAAVIQAIDHIIKCLQYLVKISKINESCLISLALISDFSYAWILIDEYTSVMQSAIKKDPSFVAKLRTLFLKLSSGLELPLIRINQAQSPDIVSVSAYYSDELVSYIRKVLQIIPETVFSQLAKIIDLQTNSMKELPTKFDKANLKEFAQFNERYQIAELSQNVAVLADGIAMMETTLVGVVQVDPKRLLEDGIRKELVNKVASTLHYGLIFNSKSKTSDLCQNLEAVALQINGFRTSFEYVQDYININSLKIWQEELTKILDFNVEQECNKLVNKNVSDQIKVLHSAEIMIPVFPPLDAQSQNFMGRLVRELIRVTDPRITVYVTQLESWFDSKSHSKVLSSTVMAQIEQSICTAGLMGVNKLLGFLITTELQILTKKFASLSEEDEYLKEVVALEASSNKQFNGFPHQEYLSIAYKAFKFCTFIMEHLLTIGQMQILRSHSASCLQDSCKYNSSNLLFALEALNNSVLQNTNKTLKISVSSQDSNGFHSLLCELSVFLEWCGMDDPLHKIYITSKPLQTSISVLLFLPVIFYMTKLHYVKSIGTLSSIKANDTIDGKPLIVGLSTVLRQYHIGNTHKFLDLLTKYISSNVLNSSSRLKGLKVNEELVPGLIIIQEIAKSFCIPTDALVVHLPALSLNLHSS